MRTRNKVNLAMSLLVRDEADIICENICFHAAHGVETFVVTDNGSTDGTRELLESLKKKYEIHIFDEPSKTIDQDIWVTRMSEWLKLNSEAEWVINNDADEFWVSTSGCLARDISAQINYEGGSEVGVIRCKRFNYLPSIVELNDIDYRFYKNNLKVIKDLENGKGSSLDNVLISLQGEKVATRVCGLERVLMGNHGARHIGGVVDSSYIEIAHYPLRTYEQFKRKVVNHGVSIQNNSRFGPEINWHLRDWYKSYLKGNLRREFSRYVISESMKKNLIQSGVLSTENRLRRELERFDHYLSEGSELAYKLVNHHV